MKKRARELIVEFDHCFSNDHLNTIRTLNKVAPEKFKEITSTMQIPIIRCNGKFYPIADWVFVKVLQENFPEQYLSCSLIKTHTNKEECFKQIQQALARQALFPSSLESFMKIDDDLLATKNLSARKYASIFNGHHSSISYAKKNNKKVIVPAFDAESEIEEELIF